MPQFAVCTAASTKGEEETAAHCGQRHAHSGWQTVSISHRWKMENCSYTYAGRAEVTC